ncbi:MAG: response regulator transcription factor [Polyangia bacterium]
MNQLSQVFLVEDHSLMRQALRGAVEGLPGLVVCGEASSAEEALAVLAAPGGVAADLVLIDMSLPGLSGIALLQKLLAHRPALRCLMLSGHRDPAYVEQALSVGARGYVLKGYPDDIVEGIAQVLAGHQYVSRALRVTSSSARPS